MADSPFRVTDSFTGEQMEFKNYDAYIAYMDNKESSASKTAKKPAKRESIQKMKTPAEKINEKIIKQSSTANIEARLDAATANSPSSFSRKDFKIGAGGSGKTEDQAAKEFADKEAYSPTGVWEFDLGYAAGLARKKKIQAAGGIEAFKAAKQEKKIARQKRKKDARAFDKQSARTTDKAKQRKKAGKLSDLMEGKQEVRNLPKNSNPYKPF